MVARPSCIGLREAELRKKARRGRPIRPRLIESLQKREVGVACVRVVAVAGTRDTDGIARSSCQRRRNEPHIGARRLPDRYIGRDYRYECAEP
jgi:hypothetical protein